MKIALGLAVAAALLGVAAPFVGSPFTSTQGGAVGQLPSVIGGENQIAPLELAGWIRARKPGLRIIDVRSPQAFAEYAIPTAENIQLADLPRASFAGGQTIVFYAENGVDDAQARAILGAMGGKHAVFINGGLVGWYVEVMSPTLTANATPQQAAAFETTAELSRYFDGEPRIGVAATPARAATTPAAPPRLADIRRRGC